MDHVMTIGTKMVVENANYTFRNMNEPAMAETTIVSNTLPDPVLESAKSLLDSMSTSSAKIAKMLKPVPSPVTKHTSHLGIKPGVAQNFGCQRTNTGLKIHRYNSNNWRPAVVPQFQIPDVNLKTTVASNEITLTLEPVPCGNNLRKVPYYARNKTFSEFTFQPVTSQIIEIDHDKRILEWHRKHVQKYLRLGPSSKSKNSSSNLKLGNGLKPHPRPNLWNQSAGTDLQAGHKRKYFEISDRYYQYLNKPKRARHDAFQVLFRSHVLLNHVESVRSAAVDDRTLYPRKFISWPSGKVIMPGYYPQRFFDKNKRRNCLKRKRTWSMYRVPKPKPLPLHRVPNNKHTYSSIMRKLMNKKLASEDRLKWDPTSRKFFVTPGQHKPSKVANSKLWFRFPSVAPGKNPVQTFNISTNSQAINNHKRKFPTSTTTTQSNWRASFKPEPIRRAIAPPRVQQKLKDIHDIFNCKVVPNPIFFKSYEIYSNTCILFQIRRLVSFKALKQGRLENKVNDPNQAGCVGTDSETPKKQKPIREVKVLSCSVLISSSTETMLSLWSTSLDKYSLVKPKYSTSVVSQDIAVSKCWLHVCNGAVIDSVGIAYADSDNVDVPKEVIYAWALDEPCNDTSTATHVINSSKRPSESSLDKDTSHGNVARRKNEIETSGGLLGSPMPMMQRLQSRLKCSPCTEIDLRRRKSYVPEPGYCVRYRFSFCTFDCVCSSSRLGTRRNTDTFSSVLSFENVILHEEEKTASPRGERSESTNDNTSVNHDVHVPDDVVENTNSTLNLDEIPQCTSGENAANQSAKPTVKDRCCDDGIGVASTCVDVVARTDEKTTRRASNWVPSQKNAVVIASTAISDHDGNVLPSVSRKKLATKPLLQGNRCLYEADKLLLSRMAGYEHEVTLRSNNMNSKCCLRSCEAHETVCNAHSETNAWGSDKAGRHCCNTIGGSCFEVGRSVIALGKRSIASATNHDSSNKASASKAVVAESDGMGNSLGKRKLLDGLGTILQINDCSETSRYIGSAGIASVNGGIQRSEVAVDTPKKESFSSFADRSECAYKGQKVTEPSEWMVIDSTYNFSGAGDPEVSDTKEGRDSSDRLTSLRSYASLEPFADETKSKTTDASLSIIHGNVLKKDKSKISTFCKTNERKATVNGGPEGNGLPATRNGFAKHRDGSDFSIEYTPESSKKVEVDFITVESDLIKPDISPCGSETQEIQYAEGESTRDCEIRSSRRLRSRVNCKKRGRYETDYVSDIPKASKKPKKVYPTNDYDNEEFWQFYSRCENTVYSQNLLLQYKYIKLFKSKGITSDCAPLIPQLSNSISPLPTSNKKRPVVPYSGIMPFLEKYTKQRKAPPELPRLSDDHCAYCGRSFVDRKKEYDDHVARHGMHYQVLSVPRLPKKKKKIFKTTKKVDSLANANGGITNAEAKEILLANSQNQRFPLGAQPSHGLGSLRPFSRPSFITMGHRKQTARKSFSIASTLPKSVLIAALECEMRAKSTTTTDTQHTRGSESTAVDKPLPDLLSNKTLIDSDVLMHSYLPKPCSARKTLTGLPITYNHLDRNFL